MPELPEVETVMRGLAKAMAGRRIAKVELRRKDLRFPFPQGFRRAARPASASRAFGGAPNISSPISKAAIALLVHLGMSGRFAVVNGAGRMRNLGEFYFEDGAPAEAARARMTMSSSTLDDGTRVIYTDPRRFGLMDLVAAKESARTSPSERIGVEPLGNEFNAAHLAEVFAGKKAPLKAALLDQTLIAGSRQYLCLRGAVPGRAVAPPQGRHARQARQGRSAARGSGPAHQAVLGEAISAGGSTLRDYAQPDGKLGVFQQRFAVYDREGKPCPRCRGRSAASSRPAARHSIARPARNEIIRGVEACR